MNHVDPQEIARALMYDMQEYKRAIDYAARIERAGGENASDYSQARQILEREQERTRAINRAATFAYADGCSDD